MPGVSCAFRVGAVAGIVVIAFIVFAGPVEAVPASPRAAMEAEYAMAIDGPDGLVVANRHGVFRTQDGGRGWSEITPKVLNGFYEHIFRIVAIGDRVWLSLEGSSVFDFLLYSFDGGRTWRTASFPGAPSDLVFTNRDDGWVTVTGPRGKSMRYASTDGGARWQRSPTASRMTASPSLVGTTIADRGAVPAGLRLEAAIQCPNGLAWAQAWGPALGTFTPKYLLRSRNDGESWALVPGP
jgi:photosystem II stability/assembly factor-like uncharacterized protein